MAYRQRYRRGHYRTRSDIGLERAIQHINEAKQLSRELGGTDKDVKDYFFSLTGARQKSLLDAYEREYGTSARLYAEEAIPLWRSGQRKMSGMVASRLFNLLPPLMPIRDKYNLVRGLWRKHSPHSNKRFRFGRDVDETELLRIAEKYLLDTIVNYKIPEQLENRFRWLSSNDVTIQQELLNHFLNIEKRLVVESLTAKLPVILNHMRRGGEYTRRVSERFHIGNHKLEFFLDPKAKGIRIESPSNYRYSASSVYRRDYWGWVIAAAILLWILYLFFLN